MQSPRSRTSAPALRPLCLGATLLLILAVALPTREAGARASNERPLPAFQGYTLEGKPLAISDYIGKRIVLFFFNPEVPTAKPVAAAMAGLAELRSSHNFEIVGIAIGSGRTEARAFQQQAGLEFPIIDDSSGIITQRLGLVSPVMVIAADQEGFMTFGVAQFDTEREDPAEGIEDRLREALRLPERPVAHPVAFGVRPEAPDFEAPRLEGGAFDVSTLKGKPFVLIFFLHTCPHCHAALAYLKKQLPQIPEAQRPRLIGVSLIDSPAVVRQTIEDEGFELDEVVLDPAREIQRLYGVDGAVPDISFVDAQGRIAYRIRGWRDKREPALTRMVLAKIAGEKIPYLLNPKGYTGSDVCAVCHELENESWQYTKHSRAFDTLVTHGEDHNPECVGCHVVGFDKPGGWSIESGPSQLEHVGCESCHGRGGPHLSKQFAKKADYTDVCVTCHNPTHSLGFDYATFRPTISHTAIASLSATEREALGRSRPGNLLPTSADYTGSAACQSCHEAEFATWSKSPHGNAFASLESKGAAGNHGCLKCHTTAFELPGGFATSASASTHPDLARVGCESCHGPGSAHIGADAEKIGTIISLGDKCDSCVILQICGGCHDDANDPGFEFEVMEKIELQRHGTIEPGTGKPLAATE